MRFQDWRRGWRRIERLHVAPVDEGHEFLDIDSARLSPLCGGLGFPALGKRRLPVGALLRGLIGEIGLRTDDFVIDAVLAHCDLDLPTSPTRMRHAPYLPEAPM